MRLLQVNSVANLGSTGRIAEGIGNMALRNGWESYIAYGRDANKSNSKLLKIGNSIDIALHGVKTRILDRHGFGSKFPTRKFVDTIDKIKPDIICLHNLHGYYLNVEILFNYLIENKIKTVWTLHDCWAFTGHCVHFDRVDCQKWRNICHQCPQTETYPASKFLDNSQKNFKNKKSLFSNHPNLTLVTPSKWLKNLVSNSFLGNQKLLVINNGIDLETFKLVTKTNNAKYLKSENDLINKKVVLGVANVWSEGKGLKDFYKLVSKLPSDYQLVLIGLTKKQLNTLPPEIIGIEKTNSIEELVVWYNRADVFVNPTYEDNFPTTNLESLACGTPVVTYDTGGSPEAIDKYTGLSVPKGDINKLEKAVINVVTNTDLYSHKACRNRAEGYFDAKKKFEQYIDLFKLINFKND